MYAPSTPALERVGGLLALAVCVVCLAAPSLAMGPDAAEDMVREVYYEGLPAAEAAHIDAAGAARLIEMLGDPAQRAHHANVLAALAASGQPGAYEAIAAWTLQPRVGEDDRAGFRAWQVLPFALGDLADSDPRALRLLDDLLRSHPGAWHFRHHDALDIARMTREAAVTALLEADLPDGHRLLDQVERWQDAPPGFREHVRERRRGWSAERGRGQGNGRGQGGRR